MRNERGIGIPQHDKKITGRFLATLAELFGVRELGTHGCAYSRARVITCESILGCCSKQDPQLPMSTSQVHVCTSHSPDNHPKLAPERSRGCCIELEGSRDKRLSSPIKQHLDPITKSFK